MWLTLGWALPWEVFTRSSHGIIHAAAHQFGKLFLVDSYYLLLRNVIIFILLQSAVLGTVLAERRRTLQRNIYGTVVCNYTKQLSKTWQIKQFWRLIMEGRAQRSSVVQKRSPPFMKSWSAQLLTTRTHPEAVDCISCTHTALVLYDLSHYYIGVQARCFHVISNLTRFRRNLLCIYDLFLLKTTLSFIIKIFWSIPVTSKRKADVAQEKRQ
jgi:hypothetical protein